MKPLLYKGFTATLEVLLEEKQILGRLEGIPDSITFAVSSVDEVVDSFQEAVDAYLRSCKMMGRVAQVPCSGQIEWTVSPNLHAAVLFAAKEYGSVDKFGEAILSQAVQSKFDL